MARVICVLSALLLLSALIPAAAEMRIALVVGNASYREAPLKNPVNDARAIARKLGTLGFKVILREDATKLEMERAVAEFGDQLGADSVSLFFYAGHGLQVDGRNFLVPTDAKIATPQRIRLETLDVDLVLDQMAAAGSPLNFIVLDACRNNPFERRFRAVGGGLAQISAPQGTLIAYATAPGKVAADGVGQNGLYTAELLKALDVPGLQVEEVFKQVRIEVTKASHGAQVPWEASSLTGAFYFRLPIPASTQTASEPAAPVPAPLPKLAVAPSPQQTPQHPALRYIPALRYEYEPVPCENSSFQIPGNVLCGRGPPLVSITTRKPIPGSSRVSAAGTDGGLSFDLRALLPEPGGNVANYSYDDLRRDLLREITRRSRVARDARDFITAGNDTLLPFAEDSINCTAFDRAGPRQGSGYAYGIRGVVCAETRTTPPTMDEVSSLLRSAQIRR